MGDDGSERFRKKRVEPVYGNRGLVQNPVERPLEILSAEGGNAREDFVKRHALTKVVGVGQASVTQQAQRSVDRGGADIGVIPAD